MKILAVGDLHGRSCWKSIEPGAYDKIVFLGDYMDGTRYTDREVYGNLLSVIRFKNRHPGKVELLLGNHDAHYMLYGHIGPCSGFSTGAYRLFRDTFLEHKRLFGIAWQYGCHLFTHAGISGQWWGWANRGSGVAAVFEKAGDIAGGLNLLHRDPARFRVLHSIGPARGGQGISGPLWADMSETMDDPLAGLHQVVGHTKTAGIITRETGSGTSVTYIDVLDSKEVFWELEI